MAQTSIHIEAVKTSSEVHNKRLKALDYVRAELTKNNSYWESDTQKNRLADIKARYKAATGQQLQKKATPIREGVVVIKNSTTMKDMQKLARVLEDRFGIKCFQIAIHKDEGHVHAKEWTPNLHAHMVFDFTDQNGKSLKLRRNDMIEMQTLVAETLGMERGVASDRKHLNAVQYKLAQRIKMLDELEHKTGAGAKIKAFLGVGELASIRKELKDANDTIKALRAQIKADKAAAVNEVSKAVADAVAGNNKKMYAAASGKTFFVGSEGSTANEVLNAIGGLRQDRDEWKEAAMSWRARYNEIQEKSESQEQNRGRSR